jgi:hypothetical protein
VLLFTHHAPLTKTKQLSGRSFRQRATADDPFITTTMSTTPESSGVEGADSKREPFDVKRKSHGKASMAAM